MSEFRRISIAQAKALIRDKAPVIVDVRDAQAFQRGALPDAHHVTINCFLRFRKGIDRARPVLVYCYHGNASQTMAEMFVDFGFSEVYSLDGGYEAWQLANEQ